MKDIEDKLKEKYDKVEVPDYMFDTSRVFKRVEEEKKDSKKKIVSIAASIITILLIATALIFTMSNILKENSNVEETVKNNNKIAKGNITLIEKDSIVETKKAENILLIKINECKDYIIINNIPYTIVKAQALKSYLGNLTEEIEVYVPGGIFSIKDIKDNVKYDKIDDISKFKDDDLVKVTYYNEIYIPVAEEGKTYIATLNEVDGKYFVNMNAKYGFKEYNEETNMVTINDYDEQLDINKYLENIK